MHLHVDSIFCRLHTKLGLCIASLAAWVDQGCNAGVLAPQPDAGSPGAPRPVEPAAATKARLLLPVPGTTGATGTGTVDPVTPVCEYDRVFN
uniref:Putative secreted protein n=1 Tax=Ixodes ricinus TaxID=34613 RepID=A0A6B0UBI9_IXORI